MAESARKFMSPHKPTNLVVPAGIPSKKASIWVESMLGAAGLADFWASAIGKEKKQKKARKVEKAERFKIAIGVIVLK